VRPVFDIEGQAPVFDVVEELTPRHLLQRLDRHEPSQTATTDSPAAQNLISTRDSDIVTRS
jgi:hypothetical protein